MFVFFCMMLSFFCVKQPVFSFFCVKQPVFSFVREAACVFFRA